MTLPAEPRRVTVEIPVAFRGLAEPHRHKALHGGRGSAKSWSIATVLDIMAVERPMRIVCGRELQNSIRESVKQLVEDRARELGMDYLLKSTESETRLKDSTFLYRGMWRNPEAIKSLEGADVFWGEEASAFSQRSLDIISPTVRRPGSELWWSWNPEYASDPIDDKYRGNHSLEKGKKWELPPDCWVKQVSWRDNPWFDLTPMRADMDHMYKTDPVKAEHVYGGGYVVALEGSYYTEQLQLARDQGRITVVNADPIVRLRACWDLGHNDNTAIWIWQAVERDVRILDHITGQGQHLSYYINAMRERGYERALCYLPHDGRNVHLTSPGSAYELLKAAGFAAEIVPNQGKGAAMARIEATRRLFPSMWFNEATTRAGRRSLMAYHEKRDPNRNVGLGPEHDWASDDADAFGMIALVHRPPVVQSKPERYRDKAGSGRASFMGV